MNVPSWDIPLWQSYPTSANANLRSALVYGTVVPIIIKMQKEMEHADEKASSIAGEVLASIRMIVACGAEGRVAKKYSGWIEESQKRGLKMSPMMGVQFAPCGLWF